MRNHGSMGLALAGFAGMACSIASAQVNRGPGAKATRTGDRLVPSSVGSLGESMSAVAEPGVDEPVRVETIMPIAIIQNGATYPVTTSNSDVPTNVYTNGIITQTAYFASSVRPRRILDRCSLVPGVGQGAPQTLTSVRTAVFALAAPATPMENVEIELEVFNDWNPTVAAGLPVNSNSLGMVRVVFAPPAGGWAPSLVYVMQAPVAIPTPIQLTDTDYSVDIRCYEPGGTGNTNLSNNVTPVLRDGGTSVFAPPDVGFSDGLYYRDASGDGIYGSTGERFFFANRLANAVVAWEADPAPTGACCLPDGSCQQITAAFCAVRSGTFTPGPCGSCTQPAAAIYNNAYTGGNPIPGVGVLSTGANSSQGPAPAGSSFCELQVENQTCANNLFGTSANSAGPFRLADDFTLTAQATISQVLIFPYVGLTGEHFPSAQPFSAATLRIWNGPPDNPASTVVFGDTATNRLASQMFVGLYRIGATLNNSLATPQQPIQTETLINRVALNVNTTLPAGTYWLDWDVTFTGSSFFPPAISPGARTVAGWNAKQLVTGVWNNVMDNGNPAGCGAGAVPQDLAFVLLGTGGGPAPCYADCDGVGGLTANDFVCFVTAYTNGASYADCDHVGGLTANDFVCFLTAYTTGCS